MYGWIGDIPCLPMAITMTNDFINHKMSTLQAKLDEFALEDFWACDSIRYRSSVKRIRHQNASPLCSGLLSYWKLLAEKWDTVTVEVEMMVGRHFQRPFLFIIDVNSIIWNHEATTGARVCLTAQRGDIQRNGQMFWLKLEKSPKPSPGVISVLCFGKLTQMHIWA